MVSAWTHIQQAMLDMKMKVGVRYKVIHSALWAAGNLPLSYALQIRRCKGLNTKLPIMRRTLWLTVATMAISRGCIVYCGVFIRRVKQYLGAERETITTWNDESH